MVSVLLKRAICGDGGCCGGFEARLFGVSWTRLPSKVGYETGSLPMTVGGGLLLGEAMMAAVVVERNDRRSKRQQRTKDGHTAESSQGINGQ